MSWTLVDPHHDLQVFIDMDAAILGLNVDLLYHGNWSSTSQVPGGQPEPDGDFFLAGLHVGVVASP